MAKLLKDLTGALQSQREAQKRLEKKVAAVTSRKARAAKRASILKELILRSGATRMEERVAILFGELADRTTQAVEEARQGAELDGEAEGGAGEGGGAAEGGGDGEDKGRWQDTAQRLQQLVLEHIRAADEVRPVLARV